MTETIKYFQDWDKICATFSDFINLQESFAWFWDTEEDAKKDLLKNRDFEILKDFLNKGRNRGEDLEDVFWFWREFKINTPWYLQVYPEWLSYKDGYNTHIIIWWETWSAWWRYYVAFISKNRRNEIDKIKIVPSSDFAQLTLSWNIELL